MMLRISTGLVVLSLCLPLLAVAQSNNSTQRDSLRARKDARDLRELRKNQKKLPDEPRQQALDDEPRNGFGLGAGYTRNEDGSRSTTTPFELYHLFGRDVKDPWTLKLRGEGYTRNRDAGGASVDGINDLVVQVDHSIGDYLNGLVKLKLPTKGDVGSAAASQAFVLGYEREINKKLTVSANGSLKHDNASEAGKSAYTKGVYADLKYTIDDDRSFLINAARTWRGGTPSTTDVGVEFDFPVIPKKLDGALLVTRGITSGSRYTSVEFDVGMKF